MSKFAGLYKGKTNSKAGALLDVVNKAIESLDQDVAGKATAYAFSTEGHSEVGASHLKRTADNLNDALIRQMTAAGLDPKEYQTQMAAATEAFILAGNPKAHFRKALHLHDSDKSFVGVGMMSGVIENRAVAAEAFNEVDNSTVRQNTVVYSLLGGKQAPAAELFFPSISIPSDNSGISATIRLYEIHDDIRHTIDGDVVSFNQRNLIDAMIDHTILRNDGTLAIPVHRAENANKFAVGMTPADLTFEGRVVKTAPLAFGVEMNLTVLSADDALLATGAMDRSDGLDQDVKLDKVWLKVGNEYIGFDTSALAGNNYLYVGQGEYRKQTLNLRTRSLFLNKESLTWAGTAPTAPALAQIADGSHYVRIKAAFTGSVDIEKGILDTEASGKVNVLEIVNVNTGAIVTDSAAVEDLRTALAAATWHGYTVGARRANKNLRERGDLVNINYYTQRWAVPTRSPVTALRPLNDSVPTGDADLLDMLATTTYARTSGAAYQTILDTVGILRALQGMPTEPGQYPEVLGVGRFVTRAMLIEDEMDATLNVGSLNSTDLEEDIMSSMVLRLRDIVYRLYRDSRFQAVVESGAAGTTEQPTVQLITDPMTARYLMVKGEIRTVGPDFKMVVKATPNKFIEGKIFVSFGYPEQNSGNDLNALSFGAHLWGGEVTYVAPISRSNGSVTKELTVYPRFRHIVNVPVLGVLTVKGLEQVVRQRVPVNFQTV